MGAALTHHLKILELQGNIMVPETNAEQKTIHIIVEINKKEHKNVEFHQDQVTGRQIKEAAGVALEDDLARRGADGKLIKVGNDETITIHEGEHFVVLPHGSIS